MKIKHVNKNRLRKEEVPFIKQSLRDQLRTPEAKKSVVGFMRVFGFIKDPEN